jgi:NADH:ubiquinone oxidoreductase subunit 4 (subunit M)
MSEITAREIVSLVPLMLIVIALGVYPAPALDMIGATMGGLVHAMQGAASAAILP